MSYDDSVRLIWSLTSNGPATSIIGPGNSGAYAATPNPGVPRTAVDLRRVDDVWFSVYAAGGAGTALTVWLDTYDSQGNLWTGAGQSPLSLTLASAPGQLAVYGGMHANATYFALPEWGRVSWTLTGTMTGVEIALFGR